MENTSIRVVSFPKSGRTWFTYLYYYYTAFLSGRLDIVKPEFERKRYMNMPTLQPEFVEHVEAWLDEKELLRFSFTHSLDRDEDAVHVYDTSSRKKLARFKRIVIVRNPVATCWSFYHHIRDGKVGYDAAQASDFHNFLRSKAYGIAKIAKYYNKMVFEKGEPMFVLRYEDLVADTAGTFRKVLEFAGYPVKDEALAYAVEQANFSKLREKEQRLLERIFGDIDAPGRKTLRFRDGRVNSYQEVMTPDDYRYARKVLGARRNHAVVKGYLGEMPKVGVFGCWRLFQKKTAAAVYISVWTFADAMLSMPALLVVV